MDGAAVNPQSRVDFISLFVPPFSVVLKDAGPALVVVVGYCSARVVASRIVWQRVCDGHRWMRQCLVIQSNSSFSGSVREETGDGVIVPRPLRATRGKWGEVRPCRGDPDRGDCEEKILSGQLSAPSLCRRTRDVVCSYVPGPITGSTPVAGPGMPHSQQHSEPFPADPNAVTVVFWDVENLGLGNCPPNDVGRRIRQWVQEERLPHLSTITCFADSTFFMPEVRNELEKISGVHFRDTAHGGKKEVADRNMICAMWAESFKVPKGSWFVIITDDNDFGLPFQTLQQCQSVAPALPIAHSGHAAMPTPAMQPCPLRPCSQAHPGHAAMRTPTMPCHLSLLVSPPPLPSVVRSSQNVMHFCNAAAVANLAHRSANWFLDVLRVPIPAPSSSPLAQNRSRSRPRSHPRVDAVRPEDPVVRHHPEIRAPFVSVTRGPIVDGTVKALKAGGYGFVEFRHAGLSTSAFFRVDNLPADIRARLAPGTAVRFVPEASPNPNEQTPWVAKELVLA
ncbi:hypothetical protein PAPYR_2716 [Paratrimastix pyriformis]|uniref:NYN domain-containing protein n=1 Tax=Paratrimastix pyriformis TaxID=342808 RepID=A0ABQ8UR02_9EUKA|nr:hypothetical protein PAPYR_2716 [Paratrimastix pyriformis]